MNINFISARFFHGCMNAGFHKKRICFTFLGIAFDFYLCNHFIFEKHQARLLVLVNIWWLSIFTRGVQLLSVVSVTRIWMVANLKDFSSTVWTSQLVDLLSPFFLKEKTHQQLSADCWVLKVVNSLCSNFYITGNSWPKAKNKAKTAQTIESTYDHYCVIKLLWCFAIMHKVHYR